MKNKKHEVLIRIYEQCKKSKNFVFNNEIIKEVSKEVGFKNQFDVTKIDSISKLPDLFIKEDVAIIHLGKGNHKFINGINKVFHQLEPIEKIIQWDYKKSILNLVNNSESNILSVANNQRILHDFLFGEDIEFNNIDIILRPKTYFPHRTKANFEYYIEENKKRKV